MDDGVEVVGVKVRVGCSCYEQLEAGHALRARPSRDVSMAPAQQLAMFGRNELRFRYLNVSLMHQKDSLYV